MEIYQCSWKPVLTGKHSIALISPPSKDATFLSWTLLVQNLRADRPPGDGGGSAGAKSSFLIPDRGLYISFPPPPPHSPLMEKYTGAGDVSNSWAVLTPSSDTRNWSGDLGGGEGSAAKVSVAETDR